MIVNIYKLIEEIFVGEIVNEGIVTIPNKMITDIGLTEDENGYHLMLFFQDNSVYYKFPLNFSIQLIDKEPINVYNLLESIICNQTLIDSTGGIVTDWKIYARDLLILTILTVKGNVIQKYIPIDTDLILENEYHLY